MQAAPQIEKPIRVGIFSTIRQAQQAVAALSDTGFTREEISVIAPHSVGPDYFGELAETPESQKSAQGAAAGGVIGALLGGLGLVAGLATTAGIGVLAAGALGSGLGGVVGGLVGAMSSRGVEKEYAHFYDQSVSRGKILVAVESHNPAKLSKAESIIAQNGAEPVPLIEG